ncbi:MAG: Dolichyl-phosphate-mannose-protein mannosyltransferase [Acidimicrobiales bacterium]|nr:Dolichyl-phosphate-mannose-protein mannosyltransferase [Acidimicrobiales bacterium]
MAEVGGFESSVLARGGLVLPVGPEEPVDLGVPVGREVAVGSEVSVVVADEADEGALPAAPRGEAWRWAGAIFPLLVVLGLPLRLGLVAVRNRAVLAMPDMQETLLAAIAARHFDQVVGPWSRIGIYHPGPMWFYWAAPFLVVSDDHQAGLVLAALALVGVCGAVICLATLRSAGRVSAGVAAAVVLVALHQLTLQGLAYPWNPTVLILPTAAGLVCAAAAVHRGSVVAMVVGAWMGSFAIQAHLGMLLVGGLVVAASAAGALARRRLELPRLGWAWAGVGVLVVIPWIPVAVDQVTGTRNLSAVGRYMVTGKVSPRFHPQGPGRTLRLSGGEVVTHAAAMTSLTEPDIARWGGAEYMWGYERPPGHTSAVVLLVLVAGVAVGARPRRRWPTGPDAFAVWVCRLGLAALVLEAVAAFRIRHEFRYYLIAGASGVGIVLWLGLALTIAELVRRAAKGRPSHLHTLRTAGAVASVVVASAVGMTLPRTLVTVPETVTDEAVITGLLEAVPTGTFVIDANEAGQLVTLQMIVAHLDQHGRRVQVRGLLIGRFSDRQRNLSHGRHQLWLAAAGGAGSGCRDLGVFNGFTVCVEPAPPAAGP